MTEKNRQFAFHVGIAEAGKVFALANDHKRALEHYREAMRLAVSTGAPEVFFRHYLEAALESLELLGDLVSVADYCERAIAHYRDNPPTHAVAHLDLATIHQRRAVIHLKAGDAEQARTHANRALALAREASAQLPLASSIERWTRSALHVAPARLVEEQRRLQYFSVRNDTVDRARAITLDQLQNAAP